MKRTILIVIAVAVIAGGLWTVRSLATRREAAPAGAATPAAPDQTENVIWASGKLVPAQWAGLSPATAGMVKTILVAEGDSVQAGQLLIELESAVLQHQVDVAAAALSEAETARASLLAGATAEQFAQAEAEVATAGANVTAAEAAREVAQRGAVAAQSQVTVAQTQYDELAGRPNPNERLAAERELELALAAVKQAQAAYDRIKTAADVAARPEALALEQATVRFDIARASYDAVTQGATPKQLAIAQAQVGAAGSQAQVAAGQVPSAEAALAAAQAQQERARAALRALQAGATAEARAVADSRVASAQAALDVAQAVLEQTRIRAPFAGQVGTISTRPGEQAVPGQALIMLGDTGRLRVETTDLRETDVTRLATGKPVEVTFDALQNRKFRGTVARVAPMSTLEKGSTNYTVVVEIADLDPALRWGMTAFVNIQD